MPRRKRRNYLIGSIVLLILIAQFPFFKPVRDGARDAIGWPAMLLDRSFGKARSALSLVKSISSLSAENAQLQAATTDQAAQIAELKTVKDENEQLKKDLNFSQTRPDLHLLPAQVISYSAIGSYQSLTINRGSKDGMKSGNAVVSSGYLVGRVSNVSDHTSEVLLLSNRNLLTPVLLTDSQTTGILKGGIEGLVVDNIPVDIKVQVGDSVVTSSLEGLYPSGIAVGTVEEVISTKEEIFTSVRISSPISISNLSTIFVVQ